MMDATTSAATTLLTREERQARRELLEDVTQFIYQEARLQDNHEYDAWEALWADDGVYWIPANGEGTDPENQMSIIFDNRSRIALRIKQFHTGKRFSQTPQSRLRRLVSNIEILGQNGDEVLVTANAVVFESATRGEQTWASRNEYRLRRDGTGFRMVGKKVILVNNEKPLWTLSFLI
jgi:3-phenylpropionate/cinnamic acid dioxygenase small subunit